MDKTVVVEVGRVKAHPKYLKRYTVHKKYKAHDENEESREGDTVIIEECKPKSKGKRWKIIEKIKEDEIANKEEGTASKKNEK